MKQKLNRTYSFTISFTGLQLLLWISAVLFVAFIGWELYWWNKIGLYFIKWHTRVFICALLLILLLCIALSSLKYVFNDDLVKKIATILIGIGGSLVVAEFLLSFVYTEKEKEALLKSFNPNVLNVYHTLPPNYSYYLTSNNEFSFQRTTNNVGFADYEWNTEKDSGVKKNNYIRR
jgi:hypothetical protein